MKKILFITHTISSGGGSEKMLQTLIGELAKDYAIDVLEWIENDASSFKPTSGNIRLIGSVAYSNKMAKSFGRSIFINKIIHNFWAIFNTIFPNLMYRHFVKDKYDIEISFNYLYSSALVGYSKNSRSKKIMWIHGALKDLNRSYPLTDIKHRLYKWLQHRAFKRADMVVGISTQTYDSIVEFEPLIKNIVKKIYNGYDFLYITKRAEEETIFKSDKFRLVSVGRMTHAKNVLLQVEAVKLLKNEGIDVELYLVGNGELEERIKEEAKHNNNIKLIGFKENPYPYIKGSDALIITSLGEGFPTVAVEAMALGKPVISTPVAGTDELITSETGLLTDWDVRDVADKIKQLMSITWNEELIKQHVSGYTKEEWAKKIKQQLENL